MTQPYLPHNTSVVLLAAGHGTRMLPLTQHTPKPLLKVGTRTLIEHHLTALRDQGFSKVIINTAYLGSLIEETLGDGERYDMSIIYSDESDTGALETAGGLKRALPLIGSDPFIVINADIWTDFDFTALLTPLQHSARLVMVPNPLHNTEGDFVLGPTGQLREKIDAEQEQTATFSGIALYRKQIFVDLPTGKHALAPVFRHLIRTEQIEAMKYDGDWVDVGTPRRLKELDARVSNLRQEMRK